MTHSNPSASASNRGSERPSRSPIGLWLAGALLTLTLGACNAAKQVPGELEYGGAAVIDWAGFVVGAEPVEY